MNTQEIEEQVNQTLEDFASRELFIPSPDWNESLMKRLFLSRKRRPKVPLILLSLGLVLLANVIFDASMVGGKAATHRADDNAMELVSRELLINPISAKE